MILLITTISIISFTFNYIYATETTTTTAINNNSNTNQTKKDFNIAIASDWGCDVNAKKTAENIQEKNPELVIAGGNLSYDKSANCWENIISPFESKLKISMGDHEYHDTKGGKEL